MRREQCQAPGGESMVTFQAAPYSTPATYYGLRAWPGPFAHPSFGPLSWKWGVIMLPTSLQSGDRAPTRMKLLHIDGPRDERCSVNIYDYDSQRWTSKVNDRSDWLGVTVSGECFTVWLGFQKTPCSCCDLTNIGARWLAWGDGTWPLECWAGESTLVL